MSRVQDEGFWRGFGVTFGCFAGICALVLLLFAGCVACTVGAAFLAEFSDNASEYTLEDMP